MKGLQFCRILLLSATFLGSPSYAASDELRETINFNRQWSFYLGDVSGAEAAAFGPSQHQIESL